MVLKSHFINPHIINIDDINSKVEAIIDFIPIPVHAVYISDEKLRIKCVNIEPRNRNAKYRIQDLSGNDLSLDNLKSIFKDMLPYFRHADVSGIFVHENDLLGSNLTTINQELTHLLSSEFEESGRFAIKKEIYKAFSSYLTNHITTDLAGSIIDLSGKIHDQLNTPIHIASELKRFETVGLDINNDDTKSYLNSYLDLNNSNEVFGTESIHSLIFIISSKINLQANMSHNCLSTESIESIIGLNQYDFFNTTNDPILPEINTEDSLWYAALCFQIEKHEQVFNENEYLLIIDGVVASGPKCFYNLIYHDLNGSYEILIEKTDINGLFVFEKLSTELESDLFEIISNNQDGSGFDLITFDTEHDYYTRSRIANKYENNINITILTTILSESVKDEEIIVKSLYDNNKIQFENKISDVSGFDIHLNHYDTNPLISFELTKLILNIETIENIFFNFFDISGNYQPEYIFSSFRKNFYNSVVDSSGKVSLNDFEFVKKIVDINLNFFSTNNLNERDDIISAILVSSQMYNTIYNNEIDISESIMNLHEIYKKISQIIKNGSLSDINTTNIQNEIVILHT